MTTPLTLARNAITALTTLNEVGNRTPTTAERTLLAGWPGWGPLAPAFAATVTGGWAQIADSLDELVPAPDLLKARDIIDTSFFTSPPVVDAVFALLRATGFTAGRILEPGCGSGNFMTGAPTDLAIDWTGVEIDPTSARLARALNPDANIITSPLQKASLVTNSFDAVIGNVPFSASTVYDRAYESTSLHEYFTLRALDAVRDGCYVIIVTSRHMMDGDNGLKRVRESADLITAVRLPSATFDGTDVVADILVLRKRVAGAAPAGWAQPTEEISNYASYGRDVTRASRLRIETGQHVAEVNAIWAQNLDCVAGTMIATSFFKSPLDVVAENPGTAIFNAAQAAVRHIVPSALVSADHDPFSGIILEDVEGRKTGSFHVVDGLTFQVINGALKPTTKASAELRALIELRDAALELITLESNPDLPNEQIIGPRAHTLGLYTAYFNKYGALNRGNLVTGKPDAETGEPTQSWRRPLLGGFRKDPDSVAVFALEQFDKDTGDARPAPILTRRVGGHPPRATSAANAEEALALTLGEGRGVNLARIGELISIDDEDAVFTELGDLVYRDPALNGQLTIARHYLAGDIRSKLTAARAAGKTNPTYWRNVEALEAVLPAELGPLDIRVQMGVTWITAADVQLFTQQVFGRSVRVEFTPAVAMWEVDARSGYATPAARLEYGTVHMSPYELVACALNNKPPVVMEDYRNPNTGEWGKRRNQENTLAAEEKLSIIQDRFATWVWEDKDRADRLVVEYNRRFNSHVVTRGDGSYLTFPGMDESINLWQWQRDAVDRIISGTKVMIGHPVGAGKTKSMIAGALTLRRMGLARKPMIVVPNHLLEQIAREAQQAYPTARFLIASKDDLTKENRRLFAARCATGDWDAVVITHQSFGSIAVEPETEYQWLEQEKSDLRGHLQSEVGGSRGAKAIASAIRKLEAKISELRYGVHDDDQITFEQLGVDHLSVDEAHMFRRLPIGSRGSGFAMGSSKRAVDLLLKVDTLGSRYPGKPVTAFFTGTPWSNTLAETYVWQRFLQPERLIEAGVGAFDAWAANFVRFESKIEVTPDGQGFRMYRRPATIQNVPELRLMLAAVADLVTADSIGLERPDAVYENIVSTPGPEQREFVENLAVRADAIRTPGSKPERPNGDGEDNMLLVCNDGRSAALDPRLVGLDEDSTKVEDAAQKIAESYRAGKNRVYGESTTPGNFQLVLCDIGTPRPNDNQVYGRLRARLIELGLPAERVRFAHDAKTDKARDHQFSQAREGHISVLIGSTAKLGVGTNIQTRLDTLHHLDAPWRPSDIEQREGRGLRPNNLNKTVFIYRYVTERSFDSFMWQTLERKQRFIAQMYIADGTIRELEDVGDTVLNFAEVKAIAAGNPELLRQAELGATVRKLRTLRSVWVQGVNRLKTEAENDRREARNLESRISAGMKVLTVMDKAPEPGMQSFHRLTETIKNGGGWGSADYRGLTVHLVQKSYTDKTSMQYLEIRHAYMGVAEVSLNGSESRKKAADLAELIFEKVNVWAAGLDKEIEGMRTRLNRRNAAADNAEFVMTASIFQQATELLSAEHALEAVEARIAESVEDRMGVAA